MSNADAHREPPASARPSGKPSLMDSPAAARVAPKGPAENLRMLVDLESFARPMKRGPARSASTWISAVALLIAAAGGTWWWAQQRSAPAPDQPAVQLSAAAPAATFVTPPATPRAAGPDATVTQAALPASGAVDTAPAAARIETMADSSTAPRTDAATVPASVPAAVASAFAATTPARVASVAKPPKRARSATTTARAAKAQASRHAKATPSHKAAISPARTAAVAPTLISGSAPGSAAAGSAGGAGATVASGGAGKDPDIVLLSALLAHVSRDAQGAPRASQTDLTIAQVVQRCEARGGTDSPEARDCRRRICEGYWGKAQACPARLATKKD